MIACVGSERIGIVLRWKSSKGSNIVIVIRLLNNRVSFAIGGFPT